MSLSTRAGESHLGHPRPAALGFCRQPASLTPIATTGIGITPTTCCPAINDKGTVAFLAEIGAGGGVFVGDGTSLTPVASTAGQFQSFSDPDINNAGVIAFFGTLKNNVNGIFTVEGAGIHTVVHSIGSLVPSGFQFVATNSRGDVGFLGSQGSDGEGIYIDSGTRTDRVIGFGSELLGSEVTSVDFFRGGLNDRGHVAFYATLSDGRVESFSPPSLPNRRVCYSSEWVRSA